jgi:predicted nucleic acid-binding protein
MQNSSLFHNVIISDTSCLIVLSNIGQLELLEKLFGRVTITPEVFDEFTKKYKERIPEWIDVKEAKNKEKVIELNTKLGLGESSSIVLASETPSSLVIIDEKKAREYALNIGLNVIGTIGIIRRAADINIIESHEKANELFRELKNKGFWLNAKLADNVNYPINSESNHTQEPAQGQTQQRKFRR